MAGRPKRRARRAAQQRAEEAAREAAQEGDSVEAELISSGVSPVRASFMKDGLAALAGLRALREANEAGTSHDDVALEGAVKAITPDEWRDDFLFVLDRCPSLSIRDCCAIVPVTPARVYHARKNDAELDNALRLHLAQFFEEEALNNSRDLPPQLVSLGLKSFAGWVDRLDVRVSEGDVEVLMTIFLEAITRATPDRKLLGRVKDELEKIMSVVASGGDPLSLDESSAYTTPAKVVEHRES